MVLWRPELSLILIILYLRLHRNFATNKTKQPVNNKAEFETNYHKEQMKHDQ